MCWPKILLIAMSLLMGLCLGWISTKIPKDGTPPKDFTSKVHRGFSRCVRLIEYDNLPCEEPTEVPTEPKMTSVSRVCFSADHYGGLEYGGKEQKSDECGCIACSGNTCCPLLVVFRKGKSADAIPNGPFLLVFEEGKFVYVIRKDKDSSYYNSVLILCTIISVLIIGGILIIKHTKQNELVCVTKHTRDSLKQLPKKVYMYLGYQLQTQAIQEQGHLFPLGNNVPRTFFTVEDDNTITSIENVDSKWFWECDLKPMREQRQHLSSIPVEKIKHHDTLLVFRTIPGILLTPRNSLSGVQQIDALDSMLFGGADNIEDHSVADYCLERLTVEETGSPGTFMDIHGVYIEEHMM